MGCNHFLGARRRWTLACRLGLQGYDVRVARVCNYELVLRDGRAFLFDFRRGVVRGPHPDPRRYCLPPEYVTVAGPVRSVSHPEGK